MGQKTTPGGTYETLEALLIAISPLYVQAMSNEVAKRFQGFVQEESEDEKGEDSSAADPGLAEGAERGVWAETK